jgi:tetrahydromethanopterin S-methyltransferase subunit A
LIAGAHPPNVSIVGTLQTENLGIERLVTNVLANPNIRFLLLCGEDSRKRIGHLPGQSLLALIDNGIDECSRIVAAKGKRPILKNITPEAVDRFRDIVEVIDRIGETDIDRILKETQSAAARDPGPADPFEALPSIRPIPGSLPERMIPDPAGYFVVHVDRPRRVLVLEHYRKDGLLDVVIEGTSAAELYCPAVERNLVSRLDHAAYLGRELARAESAVRSGEPFVQDGAPERETVTAGASCGCSTSCGEA